MGVNFYLILHFPFFIFKQFSYYTIFLQANIIFKVFYEQNLYNF